MRFQVARIERQGHTREYVGLRYELSSREHLINDKVIKFAESICIGFLWKSLETQITVQYPHIVVDPRSHNV